MSWIRHRRSVGDTVRDAWASAPLNLKLELLNELDGQMMIGT